jgi:hypothetical protein
VVERRGDSWAADSTTGTLDGGDQDGSLGATTASVEITTDSDNGAASREGSMPGSGSLAAM